MNRFLIALGFLILGTHSSLGGTIRISPHLGMIVDSKNGGIRLLGDLTNSGTDPASEVEFHFVSGRVFRVVGSLTAGQSVPVDLLLSPKEYALQTPGDYLLPFLIGLRDGAGNVVSFPKVLDVEWSVGPGGVGWKLDRVRLVEPEPASLGVSVFDVETVSAQVRNSSTESLDIEVQLLSPPEIQMKLAIRQPIHLGPGESKAVPVEVSNLAGISEVTYLGYVLFGGRGKRRHDAEANPILIRVTRAPNTDHLLVWFSVCGVLFLAMGAWRYRERDQRGGGAKTGPSTDRTS